jgi:hypothetical protein
LREKRRLRVFPNRVLRRIFWPKRDEVTGEWRELHDERFNDLCTSPKIVRMIKSRRIRLTGQVARMGERSGVYRVLVGKHDGKRPLGRTRRRWEDNINMDLREVGAWTELFVSGSGQVTGTCECDIALSVSIQCVEFLD